ncbi:hypothetical protein BD769DRAFT_1383278 [Suillus cothurnatus]|nr:hypothetical protein BD769DRAFT_1383278 [Suillus cothurnatus]
MRITTNVQSRPNALQPMAVHCKLLYRFKVSLAGKVVTQRGPLVRLSDNSDPVCSKFCCSLTLAIYSSGMQRANLPIMLGTSGIAIAGFTHTAVATTNASHTYLPSQMDHFKIRDKIGRFRILIVGRANAGKTTILQRVCNTRGIPEIYDSSGQKRRLHDIENEMIFPSNPGLIFHDSRGFEAGSNLEFDLVKAFIVLHPNGRGWQCDTGSKSQSSVPVIVLFTKFDALYDDAFAELISNGTMRKDAKELAPKHAKESFVNGPQLKFLKDVRWPPKGYVCLPDMNKDDADCEPLIKCTAGALDNEVLKQLFVSTQQTNLEVCVKYAVERTLLIHLCSTETTASEDHEGIIRELGAWFPHIIVYDEGMDVDDASDSSPFKNNVQLISAVGIILEHSFYLLDKQRYLQDKDKSVPSFYVALEQYMASPHAAAVKDDVTAAVQAYKEAVTTAARAYENAVRTAVYQGNLPAWMTKLSFEPFQRKAKEAFECSKKKEKDSLCSQAKAELIKAVFEITLKHCLSRP